MTTYIYLNTYSNDYLYVGSHTWNGPVGQLDPSYHGSSAVAIAKNWHPLKEEILEVVVDKTLQRERYWIELYAEKYGVADCAVIHAKSKTFVQRFRQHGRMLNCHSNDCSHMAKFSNSPEACAKRSYNMRVMGTHNKPNIEKITESRKRNGTFLRTKESIAKQVATMKARKIAPSREAIAKGVAAN